jgi:hypothetical protein
MGKTSLQPPANRDILNCVYDSQVHTSGVELPTSTRFIPAIHVLTSLAVTDGNPMHSEDLAFSVNTNATFIRSLLSRPQEAGLTTSQPGVRQCSFFIPSVAIASPTISAQMHSSRGRHNRQPRNRCRHDHGNL